ncbi:MAG: hypothetical protein CME59_06700 [Halioglobus sp.]|nr:hypothetical protein [Halioglobus sp.]|tara:strand:- start:3373 stop:3963 length:591 start_codon:yes stop_codon:yes gene_type:complete
MRAPVVACLVVLLQACATVPGDAPAAGSPAAGSPATGQPEPELTLNLPAADDCACDPVTARDMTFLEKGLSALAGGDHIEAVTYFQRYQRMETSPLANWEAGIAIAYDSMLSQSPFYDRGAALDSYRRLRSDEVDETRAHREILLMRDALVALGELQAEVAQLQLDKSELSEDLAKREEALKRLRELTLGQKAGAP